MFQFLTAITLAFSFIIAPSPTPSSNGVVALFPTHVPEKYGSIQGTVSDEATKEVIAFASIALQKGDSVLFSTESDFDGIYRIDSIPAGIYDVHYAYIGYTSRQIKAVAIQPDKTTTQDLVFIDESCHCVIPSDIKPLPKRKIKALERKQAKASKQQ